MRKLGTRHPERSLKQISERMVFDQLIHLATEKDCVLRRPLLHCSSVPEALEPSGGTALILSNELVDAFPCRVFEKRPDGWRELALRLDDGRIMEEWVFRPLPESTVFLHPWPDGQRVEVQESLQVWLHGWLPAWRTGTMLTIDYGDTCPALYFRRPGGTLRAYAHHQRLEGRDVYGGFGLREIRRQLPPSRRRRFPPEWPRPPAALG